MVHDIRSACRGENEIIIKKTLSCGENGLHSSFILYFVHEEFINAKKTNKNNASLNA